MPSLQPSLPITTTFPQACRQLITAAVVVPPTCRSQLAAATVQRYAACDGQCTAPTPPAAPRACAALHMRALRCQALLAACISIARSHHVSCSAHVPRSQVTVLCGAACVHDGCYSLEAQGREKYRKIESGRLPQFRIPVQTGAVARPLRCVTGCTAVLYRVYPYSTVRAHLCVLRNRARCTLYLYRSIQHDLDGISLLLMSRSLGPVSVRRATRAVVSTVYHSERRLPKISRKNVIHKMAAGWHGLLPKWSKSAKATVDRHFA